MPKVRPFTRSGGGGSDTTENLAYYYLELRTKTGLDTNLRVAPTVLVHVSEDYRTRTQRGRHTWILDMNPADTTLHGLGAGQSFTDPAGGVAFTVQAVSAASATVNIEIASGSGAPTCLGGATLSPPGPADCGGGGAGTGGTTGTGGAGTGGTATGGTATGGKATGGTATGGKASGGAATGGKASGGTGVGGAATGGKASGGTATGGAPTPGATGGTATGGVPSATGGTATGGSTATGGGGTGGIASGSGGRTDASGGNAEGGSGTGGLEPPGETDCSCTVPGSSHTTRGGLALLGLALAGVLRRRRRGTAT